MAKAKSAAKKSSGSKKAGASKAKGAAKKKPAASSKPAKKPAKKPTKASAAKAAKPTKASKPAKAPAAKSMPAKMAAKPSAAASKPAKAPAKVEVAQAKPVASKSAPAKPAATAPSKAATNGSGRASLNGSAKPTTAVAEAPVVVPAVEKSSGVEPITLHHRQLNEKETAEMRRRLVDIARQLAGDIDQMEQEAFSEAAGELQHEQSTDAGAAAYEQDFTLRIMADDGSELMEIQRAIGKIDGRVPMPYGKCESCGIWISVERLRALPHSRICIHCQNKFERQGGGEVYGVQKVKRF